MFRLSVMRVKRYTFINLIVWLLLQSYVNCNKQGSSSSSEIISHSEISSGLSSSPSNDESTALDNRYDPIQLVTSMFTRQKRQMNVQIAIALLVAIIATINVAIIALIIVALVNLGNIGYSIHHCAKGFGKNIFHVIMSLDQHGHKFFSILHLLSNILNELFYRQSQQNNAFIQLINILQHVDLGRHHTDFHNHDEHRLNAKNNTNMIPYYNIYKKHFPGPEVFYDDRHPNHNYDIVF